MGPKEVVALLFGIALLVGSAFLPARPTRWVSALCVFAAAFVGFRIVLSPLSAGVVAGGLALAAFLYLPALAQRRVVFLVPAMVVLIFATTLLMYAAPGNPFANERVATPTVEAALRARYGVPKSATEFFFVYMGRLIREGTLGPSIKVLGRSVEDLLLPAFPVSVSLGLFAVLLSVGIGASLGIIAGLKKNSAADYASMGLALIGVSFPNFLIGAGLMVVFAIWLGVLPVAGWGGYRHLVMPAIALALPSAAVIARLARSGVVEVMQQDYIRAARAKGLPESWVVVRHALRGALTPVVSYLGPAAATTMTGSFVVEVLFGVPGMGQWFVKGAVNRDYSVVLGTAIVYFGMIIVFNLLVDLAYVWLDPRLRTPKASDA
jgi:oligopeptide transport system permease protein